MATANNNPIYPGGPQIEWAPAFVTAANTAKDGTGTVGTVFTADATYGSYLKELKFRAVGSNVQTVARVFMNNGSSNAVAANNSLIGEITLAATTLTETQNQSDFVLGLDLPIPKGYKINVALGTAVAAGYQVTGIGGSYNPSV